MPVLTGELSTEDWWANTRALADRQILPGIIGLRGPDHTPFCRHHSVPEAQRVGPFLAPDWLVMSSLAPPAQHLPASVLKAFQPTHARPATAIDPAAGMATTSSGTLFRHMMKTVDVGDLPESNASAVPVHTSPQNLQLASSATPSEQDPPPSTKQQHPGAVNVAAKGAFSQVIKPRIHVMFGHDDPPSRSAPTLGAPKSEGKVQPWDAQLTAADPASFHVKAALTQSPPQQSQHDQDGTAQSNPDTSPAARDQTPSNRLEHTEKSRRLFVVGKSAASETPAAMVIPQITTDGKATL